jgi:hypothetical protein
MTRRAVEEETRMADRNPNPNSPDAGGAPGTPGWVKAFGIVAIVLVLLVALAVFTGLGGPHGPQRHESSGDAGGHARSFSASRNAGDPARSADPKQAAPAVWMTIA